MSNMTILREFCPQINNIKVQYGSTVISGNSTKNVFHDVAFDNECLSVITNLKNSTTGGVDNVSAYSFDKNSINFVNGHTTSTVNWIALGY